MNKLKLEKSIEILKPIIWKMPINDQRAAYITVLAAAYMRVPQEVIVNDDETVCPFCGGHIREIKNYCPECGQALKVGEHSEL